MDFTVNASGSVFNYVHGNQYNFLYDPNLARTELLMRLRPLGYANKSRIHQTGTCEWSKSHEKICPWLNSEAPQFSRLWLHGNPGTGKSILAAYLIKEVEHGISELEDQIVLSFFCEQRSEEKENPANVLMGFMRQCVDRPDHPYDLEVADALLDKLRSERDGYKFTIEDLEPYFSVFWKRFRKLWFIVDALDECHHAIALIDRLVKFQSDFDIKLLFVSRKERDIESRLRNWPQVEIGGKETTQADIQCFIRTEVDKLTSANSVLMKEAGRLKEGLHVAAGNMFLYVVWKCANIREVDSNRADVEEAISGLNRCPWDLDKLYEEYLRRRLRNNTKRRNQIAVRSLQWIMCSPDPVTSTLLNTVLATDVDDEGLRVSWLDEDIEGTVGKALGILVEWRRTEGGISHATLAHQSLREYLFRSQDIPQEWIAFPFPYNSLRRETAYTGLLMTCCIVICTREVMTRLQAYHNSADGRRQLHHKRSGQLQKQLCHQQMWKDWEASQLRDLEQEWRWRKEEQELVQSDLEVLGGKPGLEEWEGNQRKVLERLAEMQEQQGEQIRLLRAVMDLRERELMIYSFRYLSYHLARSGSLGDHIPAMNRAIIRLGIQIRTYASDIVDIFCQHQLHHGAASDLAIVFESLANTVDLVDQLVQSDVNAIRHGWSWSYLRDPIFRWFIRNPLARFSTDPHTVWNTEVAQVFENNKPTTYHFTLVTLALANLRRVEFALCDLDMQVPIVGTGILIHAIRHFAQMFAQWMIFHNSDLKERRVHLLSKDDFQHPTLLVNLPRRPHNQPHIDGITLLDKSLWDYRQIYPSLALLLCFLTGVLTSHPLRIAAICFVLYERLLSSLQLHNPSYVRTLHSFPPWLVAQWVLSKGCSSAVPFIAGALFGLVLHVTNVVRFWYSIVHGTLLFGAEVINARSQAVLVLFATWDYCGPVAGLLAAVLFGSKSFTDALDLVMVCYIIRRLLADSVDPTGLQRARRCLTVRSPSLLERRQESSLVLAL